MLLKDHSPLVSTANLLLNYVTTP